MTTEEFSDQFDTFLNSYNVQAGFGEGASKQAGIVLDEYEKSVFLTKAQSVLIISLYSGKNSSGEGFEATEEERRYLANLLKANTIQPISSAAGIVGMGSNSKFFTLPEDCWYITYEAVNLADAKCDAYNPMEVYPVTQDDYNRTKRNPFRGPNDRRALRLDLSDGVVEIVSKYTISSYYVRYLKKPRPIILRDLPDGLSIEGLCAETGCELHEALHHRILEMAVAMAVSSRATTTTTKNS